MRYLVHNNMHSIHTRSIHSIRPRIVEYPTYCHIFWMHPGMILTGTHCIAIGHHGYIAIFLNKQNFMHKVLAPSTLYKLATHWGPHYGRNCLRNPEYR